MADGQKIAGKTTIPVGAMAKDMIGQIYPQLTPAQVKALNSGEPIPPSPDWIPPNLGLAMDVMARAESSSSDSARIQQLNDKLVAAEEVIRDKTRIEGIFEHSLAQHADSDKIPLVSCILVFGDKDRMRIARKSVNQFVAQSYPNKQLVIINATDTPITTVRHKQIKELTTTDDQTTGAMRNFALDNCDGDWVYPHWDDDDIYDRHLLTYMVNGCKTGRATLLGAQIRVDIEHGCAYMHTDRDGIPNTMLIPKNTNARYQNMTGGEDVEFWHRHFAVTSNVINNLAWPVNSLKMCVYTGKNVLPVEKFMIDHATPEHHGKVELGENELTHMRAVLNTFGVRTAPKIPTEAVTA